VAVPEPVDEAALPEAPKADAKLSDTGLAEQIVVAMKAYDAASATREAQAKIAGRLLAEARKRHPSDRAFTKFLELAGGIQLRRAQDLIAIALDRKDYAKQQADNAAAQQRHRDKQKADRIEREAQREKAKADALRNASNEPHPKAKAPKLTPAQISVASLREFEGACRSLLPLLNKVDLNRACDLFMGITNTLRNPKKEAA
jgi:hypothetical protein